MQRSLLQKDYMIKENFTIVIPAYNEEGTIRDVVKRALKQCKRFFKPSLSPVRTRFKEITNWVKVGFC
jgi:hypothetical protein